MRTTLDATLGGLTHVAMAISVAVVLALIAFIGLALQSGVARAQESEAAPSPDRDALLALYNATDGASWTNTWDTDQPIDEWQGVTTDDEGRVRVLRLFRNNLVGVIPAELGSLAALEQLVLTGNELTGPIPSSLGGLSALKRLYLDKNQRLRRPRGGAARQRRPAGERGIRNDGEGGQTFSGPPIPEVRRIADSLRRVLRSRDGNVVGRTGGYLAGSRRDVRTQETNLGNLSADANLWMARQVDPDVAVSLKNGGGIRDGIGAVVQPPGTTAPADVVFLPPQANPDSGKREGEVSQLDIEGALRFNNGLVIVTLTAVQLAEIMEHAVGFDGAGRVTDGRFPQVGGMRFSFDLGGVGWASALSCDRRRRRDGNR